MHNIINTLRFASIEAAEEYKRDLDLNGFPLQYYLAIFRNFT